MSIASIHPSQHRAPRSRPTPVTQPLSLVQPSVKRRPKMAHAMIAVASLLAVVVAQLLLSIVLTQGAYELEGLSAESKVLARDLQQATIAVQRASSPQNLASRAAELGMVNNASPVYLRLSDGAILGAPAAASGAVPNHELVPNAALAPEPVVASPASGSADQSPAGPLTSEVKSGGAASAAQNDGLVPWQGALPSPSTR